MEIIVIEKSKNRIVFELKGETHTFANSLTKELRNDSHVKAAGYNVKHPLVGIPKIIVETDGKESPEKALIEAAKRLKKDVEKFGRAFAKEI